MLNIAINVQQINNPSIHPYDGDIKKMNLILEFIRNPIEFRPKIDYREIEKSFAEYDFREPTSYSNSISREGLFGNFLSHLMLNKIISIHSSSRMSVIKLIKVSNFCYWKGKWYQIRTNIRKNLLNDAHAMRKTHIPLCKSLLHTA